MNVKSIIAVVLLGTVSFSLYLTSCTTARITEETFVEPEVRRSVDGVLNTKLEIAYSNYEIGPDLVRLRTYENSLVGPTLEFRAGDTVNVRLINNLPPDSGSCVGEPEVSETQCNATNLHTHGLHVSPSGHSDNVLLSIMPETTWQSRFEIPEDHPAGTFWYHPHDHGSVAVQVGSGMVGALIIKGDIDEVPAIKAAKERLFIFEQIPYGILDASLRPSDWPDSLNGVEFEQVLYDFQGHAYPGYTLVNGQPYPVLTMQPGEVERWRFIHAGINEELVLSLMKVADAAALDTTLHWLRTAPRIASILETLSVWLKENIVRGGGSKMNLIAYDGITTGRIEPRSDLGLGPGNRADVMIQAPLEPGTYVLLKRELGVGKNNTEVFPDILTKVVVEGTRLDMALPTERELAPLAPFASLADLPETAIDNHHTATFLFYPQPPQKEFLGMGFDGDSTRFDTSTMEHMFLNAIKLTLGDIDEWTLQIRDNGKTQSAHPFHIHVNPFQVTKFDGQSLEHPRWQDTILLTPGHTITFRTQYTVFDGMFVFHCHFLDHEDLGMMRLVDIVRSPSN